MVKYYYPLSTPSNASITHPTRIRFLSRQPEFKELRDILIGIVKKARSVEFKKSDSLHDFLHLFDTLIPNEYFGTRKHRKVFYRIIAAILTRSKYECIYVNWFAVGFDHNKVPWLTEERKLDGHSSMVCIMTVNKWLMDNVVKPLIKKNFSFVLTREGNKLDLVSKRLWTSFQAKTFRRALILGYLTSSERIMWHEEEHLARDRVRGFVRFYPKRGYRQLNFRPIVTIFKRRDKVRFKSISRLIYAAARKDCVTQTGNLFSCWKKYCGVTKGQRVYGVKLDVIDAFGNININKLCHIIESIDSSLLSQSTKSEITGYIRNQYVYYGWNSLEKKPLVWQWKHGLLQGDWLSSSLCELYMNHLDNLHFTKFSRFNCFLHRGVDDYFFCSTSETDVRRFIATIQTIHGINRKKTQSNLQEFGDSIIEYFGHAFHMETKHVKHVYDFPKGIFLGNRFRFWNASCEILLKDAEKFIARAMRFRFNNYHYRQLYLNTIFNSEQVALENFYEAMVYLAFKFDGVVTARFRSKIRKSVVMKQIQRVVYHFSWRSNVILSKAKGDYNLDLMGMKLLLQIGYRAFIVVLKKRYLVYKSVIEDLQKKYMLKYVQGLKERGMGIKYFQSLPPAFRNISMKRKICLTEL